MNDGSTTSYCAPVRGRKCAECVWFPPSVKTCYCPVRDKQVTATMTACVLGKARAS